MNKKIVKTATGAEADGVAVDVNSLVSMNMWGLTPDFLDVLEEGLRRWTKGYTIKQPNMDCQPTEITALMRHRAVFS